MSEREPIPQWEWDGMAKACGKVFLQRRDLYARQLDDGRYWCVREWLNRQHMLAHLKGEMTLGAYVLDWRSQARYVVLDADDESHWEQLTDTSAQLVQEGIPSYLEQSRRGGHLWLFFQTPVPGRDARAFGQGLLMKYGIEDVELFPKQDVLTSGPGSLIRMPFGVHRRTGCRYGFVKPSGEHVAPTIREQIRLLAYPGTVPAAAVDAYQRLAKRSHEHEAPSTLHLSPKPDFAGTELATAPVSERIKASIGIREFIEQYVELSVAGVGKCPFHDDQHASFSVNEDEGYWHCFACGTGGSIIDFWMKKEDCDFTDAVRELAGMLL